jgi:hypothetical protein
MRCAPLFALSLTLLSSPARAQDDHPPLGPAGGPAPATQPTPPPPTPAPRAVPSPTTPANDREEPRVVRAYQPSPPGRSPDDPVVRAAGGNIGMFFRFGGLANLFATGNSKTVGSTTAGTSSASTGTDALIMTQVGVKFVLSEQWMIPIYLGTALRVSSPDKGDSHTDWGIEFGGGFEYHFRIWRRISPFVGFNLGLGVIDPTGDSNKTIGVGFGPGLGVEYYIGDRVSLTALYQFVLQVAYQELGISTSGSSVATSVTAFSFQTLAGGAMNLTYYF